MGNHARQTIKNLLQDDGGFGLIVGVLQAKRIARKMSVARLSRITGLEVRTIERLEAADFDAARVKDLLLVAKALGCHAGVALAPKREKPPRENAAILAACDKLLRSRKARVFVKRQPDRDYEQLSWTVIGDRDRNWLYVVCDNPKRNVRFAAVTAYPGGWPIRSQWAGMDGETRQVMHRMSKRLLQKHRDQLL